MVHTNLYRNPFAVCRLVSVVRLALQPTHVHAQNERNLKCGFSVLTCYAGHLFCPVVECKGDRWSPFVWLTGDNSWIVLGSLLDNLEEDVWIWHHFWGQTVKKTSTIFSKMWLRTFVEDWPLTVMNSDLFELKTWVWLKMLVATHT